VSRRDEQRIADILSAADTIRSHLMRGSLSEGLVFDAVRVRLIEIGEAVKGISAELLTTEPTIPWDQMERMRDNLAHRYFDTSHAWHIHSWTATDVDEFDNWEWSSSCR
jgi:uncharacterized protein with HEPN domain